MNTNLLALNVVKVTLQNGISSWNLEVYFSETRC